MRCSFRFPVAAHGLASGTGVDVAGCIVGERRRVEFGRDAPPLHLRGRLRRAFLKRPDKVDLLLVERQDVLAAGEAAVDHQLLRSTTQISFDAFDPGNQLSIP